MKCANEAMLGKALCPSCLDHAHARHSPRRHEVVTERSVGNLPSHIKRFLAAHFDGCVVGIVTLILSRLFAVFAMIDRSQLLVLSRGGASSVDLTKAGEGLQALIPLLALAVLIPAVAYAISFETSQFRATPGKLLFGLKVCRMDGSDQPIDFGQASRRFAIKGSPYLFPLVLALGASLLFVSMGLAAFVLIAGAVVTLLLGVLDPISILLTRDRRALHDMSATSIVVECPGEGLPFIFGLLACIAISVVVLLLS